MSMIYFEDSGNIDYLTEKTIGIIGYGDVGQAFALNMRDSGIDILVSPHGAEQSTIAEGHNIPIATTAVVAQKSQILILTLPDEIMPAVYMQSISPYLQRGYSLIFSSAYNVAFGYIEPPPFVDVGLVSPRSTGYVMREKYVSGEGGQSFVAVGQDASRSAWETVLAVAAASGALRGGAAEVHFEQEAELSLFVQQALIPVFHHLMITAASLLMRSGYPAEAALSDLYLSGKFQNYLAQTEKMGLLHAIQQANQIGQYATLSRLNRFADLKLERLLEVTLDEIRNGDFAREWSREYTDNVPRLSKLMKLQESIDVWDWEQQTIELFDQRTEIW